VSSGSRLSQTVVQRCLDAGFAAAGVCDVAPSAHVEAFGAWLDAGKHGSMGWLADHADVRTDPSKLLDGARSAVMVADLYASRAGEPEPVCPPGAGRVARYARGRDYHRAIKKRLHAVCDRLREEIPGAGFRSFADTAPVMERELAARAGLGWTGKHTLTIHPRLGSWFLLGGFVTTLELEPPVDQAPAVDRCGSCARCIEACPTDAITPYSVDASRCISYLTIEHREPIDAGWHRAVGAWLFGCDICQEVCPHNSPKDPAWAEGRTHHEYGTASSSFDLLEVLGWDQTARRSGALTGSAMKRATLSMWKRNAVIVAGNRLASGVPVRGLRERIAEIAADRDEDDLVRTTARDVLARLGDESG
jgi:epoxyqueuosine reductase